jgi:hypothetical protein
LAEHLLCTRHFSRHLVYHLIKCSQPMWAGLLFYVRERVVP